MKNQKKLIFIFIVCLTFTIVCAEAFKDQNEENLSKLNASKQTIIYKNIGNIELLMDIYKSKEQNPKKSPVVMYIHGGGFVKGSRDNISTTHPIVYELIKLGYTFISIDYRLLDNNIHFPSNIEDVKDSIRWIHKNSDEYNLDADNITLWGTSAGGHLALIAAYTGDDQFEGSEEYKGFSSSVNNIIDMFGLTDFRTFYNFSNFSDKEWNNFNMISKILYGKSISKDGINEEFFQYIDKFSPLTYVGNETVDSLIIHGTIDKTVNIQQSEIISKKLDEFERNYEFLIIEGVGHGFKNATSEQLFKIYKTVNDFILNHYQN